MRTAVLSCYVLGSGNPDDSYDQTFIPFLYCIDFVGYTDNALTLKEINFISNKVKCFSFTKITSFEVRSQMIETLRLTKTSLLLTLSWL